MATHFFICNAKDSSVKVIAVSQYVILLAQITESLERFFLTPFLGPWIQCKMGFKQHVDVHTVPLASFKPVLKT
jgi:hypothetical protein